MSKYIYIRVSTEEQNFGQQMKCIEDHFARIGESMSNIDCIFKEKKSGKISYLNRPQLSALSEQMQRGDTIYVAEFSRLGRNMIDILNFVKLCDDREVTIITCKDGLRIEAGSMMGKCLIFAFGIAAEVQVQNISQNTKDGLAVARANGKRIGREKGCDTTKASIASAKVRQAKANIWRESSLGYKDVTRWIREGKTTDFIIHEFNAHHESDPKGYSTRNGGRLTESTLKRWRGEIKTMGLA